MKHAARLFFVVLLSLAGQMAFSADVRFNGVEPAVIIDVRTPQEFAAGHVEGAINIPHDRIEQAIDSIEGLEKNSSILLYCQSGARSAFACQVLAQRGYTRAMNGGAMATLLLNFERA